MQIFEAHSEETLNKVVPVIGVMDAENMGFDEKTLKELRENVNVIFHVAATIKFNTHLRVAIRTNLTGTLRCIEFGKSLNSLAAFVHLSTAFCNSNYGGLLEEKVYPPVQDPYDMLKMAENDDAWVNVKTRADWLHITKEHPNTYTFTKQLAENLVMKELAGYPAAIVRPSIGMYCAMCVHVWKHVPLWFDRSHTHTHMHIRTHARSLELNIVNRTSDANAFVMLNCCN